MRRSHHHHDHYILLAFATFIAVCAPAPGWAVAQSIAPEIAVNDRVPEGLAASDWSSIRAAYESNRHAAFTVDGGYQARNPGQQWRTRFDGRGFLTTPDAGDWSWGLELLSYGRAGVEQAVIAASCVEADGGQVCYQWDDVLTEWYVNDQRGLEHGYTVHRRPEGFTGVTPMPPLQLTLAVRGDLHPRVSAGGRGVTFVNGAGASVVNYHGLTVLDAGGAALPSWFEASSGALVLSVDDRGARYPLTIDPVAQQAYLKASNTESGDQFGTSVAVSGDTVVVGAFKEDSSATGVGGNQSDNSFVDSGAAYVFVRGAGGIWSQQAYLKASNTESGDRFGDSVAVSGDTVIVGASSEASNATGVDGNQSDNSAVLAGAAYVFVRGAGGLWSQQAYLKASDTDSGDLFGLSVAASGNTVVVGAFGESSNATGVDGNQADNSAAAAGAAYIFVRGAGGLWSQQAYLKASNTDSRDFFGYSVAVSGDTVVVGALDEGSNATGVGGNQGDNSAGGSGAAYVFVRGAGSLWSQQAYLKASNTDSLDEFGVSVAASGNTVVIGAFAEDSNAGGVDGNQTNNSADGSGAAYVFVRAAGGVWSQQAYLKASNTNSLDRFGRSVAVSGDTVVVGAFREDSNAVGVDGNQADNSAIRAGAAYVFVRAAGGLWSQQAYLKASNTDGADEFGRSVAASGDTVVVGAFAEDSNAGGVNGNQADNSAGAAGAAYVFLVPPDCNSNGIFDDTDITAGTSQDCNANAIPDECEADSDGDGTIDDCDNCPADPNKTAPGTCGCGVSDADTDVDGTPDCFDNCPSDPNKLDPGICGCGTPDSLTDADNDGVIDCLDNCPAASNADQADSDGNGVGDVCEPPPAGQSANGCGDGVCGMGAGMAMPMMLLGLGWMRRRRTRVRS